MNYPRTGEVVPGSFDHRSGDCPTHGGNVVFARPARSTMGFECVACLVSVAKATLPLRQAPVSHAMFIRLATNKALEKHIVFPDHKTGQILPCSRVGAAMDGFANILLALQEDASEQPQVSVSGSNSYWYPDGK